MLATFGWKPSIDLQLWALATCLVSLWHSFSNFFIYVHEKTWIWRFAVWRWGFLTSWPAQINDFSITPQSSVDFKATFLLNCHFVFKLFPPFSSFLSFLPYCFRLFRWLVTSSHIWLTGQLTHTVLLWFSILLFLLFDPDTGLIVSTFTCS